MTEPHKRPYRHPKYQTAYRVKNWHEDDQSLRDHGDITLWISQNAIDAWSPPMTGKRGAQPVYADIAIEGSNRNGIQLSGTSSLLSPCGESFRMRFQEDL